MTDHGLFKYYYDGSDNLLRKFVYGPGIDEPICMIDVSESNKVYYYHFDGLGSVAAISDVNAGIAGQIKGSDTLLTAFYLTDRLTLQRKVSSRIHAACADNFL